MLKYAPNKIFENQDDVGTWGGTCTCPNGESYEVDFVFGLFVAIVTIEHSFTHNGK